MSEVICFALLSISRRRTRLAKDDLASEEVVVGTRKPLSGNRIGRQKKTLSRTLFHRQFPFLHFEIICCLLQR